MYVSSSMRRVPEEGQPASNIEREVLALAMACLRNKEGAARQDMKLSITESYSEPTIKRRLQLALEWGWLRREGAGRATVYVPSEEFRHVMAMRHIAMPQHLKKRAEYDIAVLQDYVPNKTFYLSQQQRNRLHERCRAGSFNGKDPAQGQLMRRFMADLSHHSALLEGVRANYIDTIQLLENNIQSRHLSEEDAIILRNHYNAARLLVMASGFPPDPRDFRVCETDICQVHAVVSDGLLRDRRDQGRLRHVPVEIQRSSYIPLGIPDQIHAAFRLLVDKAREIEDPYEQSFFLAVHIPYLQPFVDCNKRTARVACNIPLLNKGVLPISWCEVSLRDYHDALLCVYESQSFFGMAQIFTEAYLRGVERFEAEQTQRRPSRLEVTYAREIEQVIRRRVLEADTAYEPNIAPQDWGYVRGYIDSVLQSALENDMVLAPYGIRHEEWRRWREQVVQSEAFHDDPGERPTAA